MRSVEGVQPLRCRIHFYVGGEVDEVAGDGEMRRPGLDDLFQQPLQRVAEELFAAVAAPVHIAGNAFREQFEESQVW
jgi:hypothetical protein